MIATAYNTVFTARSRSLKPSTFYVGELEFWKMVIRAFDHNEE